MYTSFRVQNFRGFEDLELPSLAHINLIGGKNNTGKSSLLEAISLHASGANLERVFRSFQLTDGSYILYPFSLIFNNSDTEKEIYLSDGTESFLIRYLNRNEIDSIIAEREKNQYLMFHVVGDKNNPDLVTYSEGIEIFSASTKSEFYLFNSDNRILQHRLSKRIYKANLLSNYELIRASTNVYRNFSNLKQDDRYSILIETLNLLESRLTTLELLGEVPTLYGYLNKLTKPIPITAMGDGLQRLCVIVLAMSGVEGGVLLIDEIENGLHHSVLPDIWRAIYQAALAFNVQIFATTHSDEMIHAAQQAFANDPDALRYYRLDRKKTGEIKAVMYEPEILAEAMLGNFEVRG